MTWVYRQSDGAMWHQECGQPRLEMKGYAGCGEGLNNPAYQSFHAMGPLPQGGYWIEVPHNSNSTGPYTMNLSPDAENQMFGRADFRIHGDNSHQDHSASHGCIVLGHEDRVAVWGSGDRVLRVVE